MRTRMDAIKTACCFCKPFCGLLVSVENGKIVKVEPDPEDRMSQGAICPKALASKQLIYHPDRVLHPMKKDDGTWTKIGWDEALDTVAENILKFKQSYGPESILVAHGTERNLSGYAERFANTVGTPNRMEPGGAQCYWPRGIACKYTFGEMVYYLFEFDYTNTNCMLVIGMNNLIAGHQAYRSAVLDAKQRGAKLIVVDPRFTNLAARADLWLQIRPGTDDALLLSFMNVMIEEGLYDRSFIDTWTIGFPELREHVKPFTPEWAEKITWIKADLIRAAARMYATQGPSVLDLGVATDQSPNSFQTARAAAILVALSGYVDVPGGNPMYRRAAYTDPLLTHDFKLPELIPEERLKKRLGADTYKLLGGPIAAMSHVPAVWKAILEEKPYPIKAMLAFWTNPLISYANTNKVYRALKKLEFILSVDFFLTPTARHADIFLPAATFLERDGIANYYGQGLALLAMPKVIEPVGECWDDKKIFMELSKRIGMGKYWPWESVEEHIDGLLQPMGITYGQLKDMKQVLFPREYRKYEKSGFKTASGKVEIYSRELEKMGYEPLPVYREPPESPYSTPEVAQEFPLVLITGGRTSLYNHTEMRMIPWLREIQSEPVVEIHPKTARAHGIDQGDLVKIESRRGRVFLKADLTLGIDPRVISCKSRWWYPERGPEDESWLDSNSNVLTSDDPPYDPALGSYQLRALLCRIGKGD